MTEPVDWRTICEEQESYPLANILRERPSWLTRVLAGLIVLCVVIEASNWIYHLMK